eukprot:6318159-Prymnesium_polylepis.1
MAQYACGLGCSQRPREELRSDRRGAGGGARARTLRAIRPTSRRCPFFALPAPPAGASPLCHVPAGRAAADAAARTRAAPRRMRRARHRHRLR